MASIIVDLSDDIKKLQSLKAEIQEVKKELGSINVNVHLDIKRDMEAKLKSLTSQYDALVKKVSEAEGKVIASTQRINQAAEKIIKAQEQLAKATGAQPQTGNASSGANAAAANAETASVQAQAKAYDELRGTINESLGTFTEQIRRWNESTNAIRLYNKELKEIKKTQSERNTDYTDAEIRRMGVLNSAIEANRQKRNQASREMRNQIKIYQAADGSLNQLRAQLIQMKNAYAEMSDRGTKEAQEMLASIQQANAKISEIEQSMGVYSRNVGNYASGWNGLSMSIQQIGRELPSLAMGWNTFFLAISNNLPILSDELARARKEYNELKAAGQQATPVWKQVVSSLLSWQTALTVGITLLTLYGKEMVEWIGGLFKAKKQLDLGKESVKAFNEAMLEGGKNAQQEITTLNLLYRATQNTAKGMNERLAAVDELQKQYPSYFGNMSKEEILAGKAADSYVRLAQSITASAKAKAAMDSMVEQQSKILENEREINSLYAKREPLERKLEQAQDKYNKAVAEGLNMESLQVLDAMVRSYQRDIDSIDKDIAKYRSNIYQSNKISKDLEKNINIEDLIFDSKGTKETKSKAIDNLKDYLSEMTSLVEDNEDRQVELMKEGTDKEVAEIELRYKRMREKVQELEKNLAKAQGGKLTDGQKAVFGTAYSSVEKLQEKEIGKVNEKLHEDEQKKLEEQEAAWNEYLIRFGDYQQKRKAIIEKYNKEIEEAETAGDAAILHKEQQNALDELDNSIKGSTTLMGQLFADASERSVNEIQKIIDKAELLMGYLGAEKDRQGNADVNGTQVSRKQILELGISENSLKNLESSTEEVEALRRAIENLKGELGSRSPFKQFENDIKDAANAIRSGNLAKGIEGIGSAVSSFAPALSQFGEDLGNIFGNDGLGGKIAGISESIGGLGQAAAGVGQAMSGDIVGGIMSAVGGISTIVSAFKGLFGADYSEFNEMKARYDELSGIWDTLISKKQEYIDISYGAEAAKAYDEALSLLEQQQEYARQLAETRKNSGASVGSHSIGYRQNEWLGSYASELYKYIDQNGNYNDITNALLGASADQLREVRENMWEFWQGLDDDFQSALDDIIDADDQIDELKESLKNALTGIDFDSFQSGFADMLSDLESDNQDFADDLEKKLQNAMFSSLVANQYKDRIQALYDQWSDYAQSDESLTADEADKIREEYNQIVSDMLEDRDKLMESMGWSAEDQKQQSASAGGLRLWRNRTTG